MAAFLKELLLAVASSSYAQYVEADFKRCMEIHFADIGKVVPAQPGPNAEPSPTLLAALQQAQQ